MSDRVVSLASAKTVRRAARREKTAEKKAAIALRLKGPKLNWDIMRKVVSQLDEIKDRSALAACAKASRTMHDIANEPLHYTFEYDLASSDPARDLFFKGTPEKLAGLDQRSLAWDEGPQSYKPIPRPRSSLFSCTKHLFIRPHCCDTLGEWTPPPVSSGNVPVVLDTVRLDNRRFPQVEGRSSTGHTPQTTDGTMTPWTCPVLAALDFKKLVVIHGDHLNPFPVTQSLPKGCTEVTSIIEPFYVCNQPKIDVPAASQFPPQVKVYTLVLWPFRTGQKGAAYDQAIKERQLSETWRQDLYFSLRKQIRRMPSDTRVDLVGFERVSPTGYINDPNSLWCDNAWYDERVWDHITFLGRIARRQGLDTLAAARNFCDANPDLRDRIRRRPASQGTGEINMPNLHIWLKGSEANGALTPEDLADYRDLPLKVFYMPYGPYDKHFWTAIKTPLPDDQGPD